MSPNSAFQVDASPDIDPGQTLLVGLSSVGLAGLTATDHLVRHCDSEEIGHVSPDELPAITPIQDGHPRHHTRLYNLTEVDLTVLVGELFVPVWAGHSFAETLLEWVESVQIEEIAVLHGVAIPHGPEEHEVFHVATEEYQELRLAETETRPLQGGYLDGIPGELVSRSLDGDAPPVGVYVTPTHPPGPDIDASLKFLDTIEDSYDVSVDLSELEDRSDAIQKHYAALADRMEKLREVEDSRADQEYAEDRMFM